MGLVMDSDLALAPAADAVPAPATAAAEAEAEAGSASPLSPTVAPKLLEVHADGADGQDAREAKEEEVGDKNDKESGQGDGEGEAGQGESAYCLCRKPDTGGEPMLMCDACSLWFHIGCVGISDIDHYEDNPSLKWYCPYCSGKQQRPAKGPLSKIPSRAPSPNSLADAELALAQAAAASSASSTHSKGNGKRGRRTSTSTSTSTSTTKRTRTKSATTAAAKKRNTTAATTSTAQDKKMATSANDDTSAAASAATNAQLEQEPAVPTSPASAATTPVTRTYHARTTRSSKSRTSSTSDTTVQSPPTSPTAAAAASKVTSPMTSPKSATARPTKRRASESATDADPTTANTAASPLGLTVHIPAPPSLTHSPTSASGPSSPTPPTGPTSAAPRIAVRRSSTSTPMGPPSRTSSTHSATADATPSAPKRAAKSCSRPACDNRIDSAVYAPYCSQQCKTMVLAASHQRSASTHMSTPTTFAAAAAAAAGGVPEPVSPTTIPLAAYQRFKVAQDAVDVAERKTRDAMRKIIATALASVLGKPPTDKELAALTDGGLPPPEHERDATMTRVLAAAETQTLAVALEDAVYMSAAPPRDSVTLTLPGADTPSTHAFRTSPLSGATETAYRVSVRKLLTSLKSAKSDRLHAKLRRGLWTAHAAVAADPVEYSTETAREYERARMQTLAQTVRESRDDEEVLVKKTHKGEVEVHRAAAGGLEDDRDIQMARAVAAAAARSKEVGDGERRERGLLSPTAAGHSPTGESTDTLMTLSDTHSTARSSAAELNKLPAMRRLSENAAAAGNVRRSSSMSALAAGPLVVAEEASARRAGEAVSKLPDVADDVDAMMHGVSDQVVGQVVDLTGEDDEVKKSGDGEAGVAKLPVRADQVVDMLMDTEGEEDESVEEQADARSKPAPSMFTADSMLLNDDDDEDGGSNESSAPATDSTASSLLRLFQGGQGGQGDDAAVYSDTDDNHMQSIVFSSPVRSPTPDPVEAAARAQAATWTGPLVEIGREPIGVQFVQVGGRKLSGVSLRDQWSPSYFAPEMRIDGRLSVRRANDHLVNCHHSQSREAFVFEVQPDQSQRPGDAPLLDVLFDECHSHGKVAVIQRHDKIKPPHPVYLKDLYLYPLKPEDALPDWCRLFENQVSGIRTSNVILAVLVGLTDQTPPSHPSAAPSPASSMPPPPGLPQRNRDMVSTSSTWSPRDSGRDAYRIASPNTSSSSIKIREPSAWSPHRTVHQDSPINSSNGSQSLSGTPTTTNANTNAVAAPVDPWDSWGGNATPRRDNPSAMSPPNTAGALSTPPYTVTGNATPLYNQQTQQQQQQYGSTYMGGATPSPAPVPYQGPVAAYGAPQFGMPAVNPPTAQWSQHTAALGAAPAPAPVSAINPHWTPQLIAGLQVIPDMPPLDLTQPPTQMHLTLLAAYIRHQQEQQQQQQLPQQYGANAAYQGYNPYDAANRRW